MPLNLNLLLMKLLSRNNIYGQQPWLDRCFVQQHPKAEPELQLASAVRLWSTFFLTLVACQVLGRQDTKSTLVSSAAWRENFDFFSSIFIFFLRFTTTFLERLLSRPITRSMHGGKGQGGGHGLLSLSPPFGAGRQTGKWLTSTPPSYDPLRSHASMNKQKKKKN